MRISKQKIYAADDEFDEGFDEGFDDAEDGFMVDNADDNLDDKLDDMADDLEDMQEDLDDITEDDPNIDVDNNIEGHYIAECDRCKGIFISAMIQSDQEVEKISGVCPLCNRESDQFIKWVVKALDE